MQAVVFQEYPAVSEAYRALEKLGKTLMTGSGACLFATFDSKDEAAAAFRQISKNYEAYCVKGLARHPLQG